MTGQDVSLSANKPYLQAEKLSLIGKHACAATTPTLPHSVTLYDSLQSFCLMKPLAGFRCNFDERQRATWVRIANEGSHRGQVFVMGLHLDIPPDLCIHRAQGRTDHPTLNGSNVVDVIHRCDIKYMILFTSNALTNSTVASLHIMQITLLHTLQATHYQKWAATALITTSVLCSRSLHCTCSC